MTDDNNYLYVLNDFDLLTKKEKIYYKMIDLYFKECKFDHIINMVNIIDGKSKISLRILDWFVTRYSNKYKTCIYNEYNNDIFNIYISYKAQLKSYKKRYFDPFRRRQKIYYNYDIKDPSKQLFTTIGQLNFFRWAISNKIIEYIEKNYNNIIKIMNISNKEDKINKENKYIKKLTSNFNDNVKVSSSSDDTFSILLSTSQSSSILLDFD